MSIQPSSPREHHPAAWLLGRVLAWLTILAVAAASVMAIALVIVGIAWALGVPVMSVVWVTAWLAAGVLVGVLVA